MNLRGCQRSTLVSIVIAYVHPTSLSLIIVIITRLLIMYDHPSACCIGDRAFCKLMPYKTVDANGMAQMELYVDSSNVIKISVQRSQTEQKPQMTTLSFQDKPSAHSQRRFQFTTTHGCQRFWKRSIHIRSRLHVTPLQNQRLTRIAIV